MKRPLYILIAAMFIMALAAGCSSPTPASASPTQGASSPSPADSSPSPGTGPDDARDPGELNLAIFEGGTGSDYWYEITRLFEEETGVKVNLQISPNIGDTIRPQIVAGKVPDFMNLADSDASGVVAAMIKDRALMNLDDVFNGPQYDSDEPLRNKIVAGFLESGKCAPYENDPGVYLAPETCGPMGPIYNITLFGEKGWNLPVTWDEYFDLGGKAKAEGIALQTYQGVHPGYWESIIFPNLASALGDDYHKIEDGSDPSIWSDPRAIAVLEQYEKIYTTGNLMKGTVALNHTQAQAAQMMNQALFIPCGTWMEEEMKDAERAEGYRFGIAPPPVLNARDTRYVAAYVGQLSIPANAENPENAKLFLRFLYTDKSVELYAKLGGGAIMATTSALELVKPFVSEGVYGMHAVFNEPGATALIFSMPVPPENSKVVIKDEFFNPLGDVMTGKMTGKQWAENLQKAYQDMADGK